MNKCIKFIFVLCIGALLVTACSSKKSDAQQQQENLITVESKPVITTLSFSGVLKPHKEYSITAPNSGTIESMSFKYGQRIEKNQLLFTLNSSKQEEQFETALSSYLKAKQTMSTDRGRWQSTQGLYEKGLVSEDEYNQAKSSYYLSRLSLLQAESRLQNTLKIFKTSINVFSLSIEDIEAIGKTLARTKKLDKLDITSPVDGVALFSSTGGGSGSSAGGSSKSVGVGADIKKGQVLATIGEFKGLTISAKASEVNINQLKVGLPATVTSVAFPGVTLKGFIHEIDSQAISSGGLPQFRVLILIPRLTPPARKVIKVGMSAQAIIDIKSEAKIQVPIAAVFQKRGKSTVKKMVNGKAVDVAIQTGKTSMNSVVVLSGLKAGDKIVGSY